ncbi:hypothetical protein GCM10009785_05420 [Brooklawnia cerclae]|uniref:Transglutaminase-like domain-containing protein n=1 Tax=Brooklawnia cerclae TaxID=349934 RepID=A0ABX0SGK8_9ACTN|nr:hypothetical protein [Brooklawnia cerclae]NIH55866.1 hypothetical protein [Brooklawnia cerclae]
MNRKSKFWLAVAGVVGVIAVPVVARAPKPVPNLPRDVRTLDEALDDCLATSLDGWELVDYATRLVNQKFTRYSLWHLWEGSGVAFRNSRGFSDQYNMALGRVLAGLGFEVQVVQAARVRFTPPRPGSAPWWVIRHTWLRVTHAGRTLDVCASRADHRAGHVRFAPLSDVRPVYPWSTVDTRLGLAGPVAYQVWKAWFTGEAVPRWMYRGFHDQG